jgi:hypothetical protein
MMACPYAIPRYEWSDPVPYVRKCVLCHEQITSKKLDQPACTKACPNEATQYGERDELLQIARERIRAHPGRYIDRIYGEHEVGGTSVLYLSDVPLDFLGLKDDLGDVPLPARTAPALLSVPPVFLGVGTAMYSLHWIIGRRMRLERERAAREAPTAPEQPQSDEEPNEE